MRSALTDASREGADRREDRLQVVVMAAILEQLREVEGCLAVEVELGDDAA